MTPCPLTAQACALYRAGRSVTEIVRLIGWPQHRIRRALEQEGLR
ncbi:hypothetical protein [Deinococcus petrolearius]|uniref:Transposase IS30-like HTH domain-containing protein n=1 Tax=Deinococcus petrolearius TaxID=1751295 RepID=A0ABW1DD33_9DEIO